MKKTKLYTKAIALVLLVGGALTQLTSCKEEGAGLVAFGINQEDTDLEFPDNGGAYGIKLSANDEWSVESNAEWCMVSPANGNKSTVCELRVDSSYLYKGREATLIFRSGSRTVPVRIFQYGYEKIIKLETDKIEVEDFPGYDKMFEDIKVTSNVKFKIDIEAKEAGEDTKWVRVTQESIKIGSIPRPSHIRVDFDLYTKSDKNREVRIVLSPENASDEATPATLDFIQKKAQKITPSRAGDSLAILTLARIMRCYSKWEPSQSMIHWTNVILDEVKYKPLEGDSIIEQRVVGLRFFLFNTDNTIPYQIEYLDQLQSLVFTGNENSFRKKIPLGEEVTKLKKLKHLAFIGYGISSLPASMKDMESLEELDMSGNAFTELPIELFKELNNKKKPLKYLSMTGNRANSVNNLFTETRDTIGMKGTLPEDLFLLNNLEYLSLSYNCLDGTIPDFGGRTDIMPQLKHLALNLNFFSGTLPQWILKHPRLKCWDPYTLVFPQEYNARDSKNNRVGFTNEPSYVEQPCPDWEESENEETRRLTPDSYRKDFKFARYFDEEKKIYPMLPLVGSWANIE